MENGVVDKVGAWRQEILERAGYEPSDALYLASDHNVDLHRAVELIKSGCPASTAMRILT
jgi:hypothetical protein